MTKPPARVLVVASVVDVVERFLLPYLKYFTGEARKVGVASEGVMRLRGRVPETVLLHDLPFGRSAMKVWHYLPAIKLLRQVVDREGYDLIFVHNPIAGWLTRFALRGRRMAGCVRVVYMCHGFHFAPGLPRWWNALFYGLERRAARWCDLIITINAHDYAAACSWVAESGVRVVQVPGVGVPLERFRLDEEVKRRGRELVGALGVPAGDRVVCCVGDLMPGKRTADCILAIAGLRRGDVWLLLAGAGPEEKRLQALAVELGVRSRVIFLGHCGDIPGLLAASSVLVMPSEREGLPRSVMEAMAMGVPVIGAAARGTRDLLEEKRGWVVPVGDHKAIASAIEEVLTGDERVQRITAARQHVAKFGVDQAMARILEAIDELTTLPR